MITAADVIRVARSYVGVPFRHQGRSRSGIDCVGLPIVVLQELGLLEPDFEITNYARTPDGNSGELMRRVILYCEPIAEAVPGSLLAIRWKRQIAHVALMTERQSIIHASSRGAKAVVEHGFHGKWLKILAGAYALPGVRYG